MTFTSNQVVSIHYTLTDADGNILDSTREEGPMSFLSGQDEILPKLESEMAGLSLNSKKKIVLAPEDAYGPYDPEDIQVVSRHDLPDDVELEVGLELLAEFGEDEEESCYISKIQGDEITLDFNHPLAGKELHFEVEVVDVRDATEEERSHGHVHGPDGHVDD